RFSRSARTRAASACARASASGQNSMKAVTFGSPRRRRPPSTTRPSAPWTSTFTRTPASKARASSAKSSSRTVSAATERPDEFRTEPGSKECAPKFASSRCSRTTPALFETAALMGRTFVNPFSATFRVKSSKWGGSGSNAYTRPEGVHPAGRSDGARREKCVVPDVRTDVEDAHPLLRVREKRRGLQWLPDLVAEEVCRDDAVARVHPHGHPVHDDAPLAAGEDEAVEQRIRLPGSGDARNARAGERHGELREGPLNAGPRAHAASSP